MDNRRNRVKPLVTSGVTAALILLAILIAVYAVRLLVVGQQLAVVQEVAIGEVAPGESEVTTEYARYPAAVVPLLAAISFLFGLLARRIAIAWISLAVLLAFSVVFLFSSGIIFLPAIGFMLILLAVKHFMSTKANKMTQSTHYKPSP